MMGKGEENSFCNSHVMGVEIAKECWDSAAHDLNILQAVMILVYVCYLLGCQRPEENDSPSYLEYLQRCCGMGRQVSALEEMLVLSIGTL